MSIQGSTYQTLMDLGCNQTTSVMQDTQTKEELAQLLVPKSYRELLFHTAHHSPMVGHLGQDKTLNRLMANFYWPGARSNIRRWFAAYCKYQMVNPLATPKAPFIIN